MEIGLIFVHDVSCLWVEQHAAQNRHLFFHPLCDSTPFDHVF